MPEAVSFRVMIYRKFAKGDTGITHVGSRRLDAGNALNLICDETWHVTHEKVEGSEWDKVTLVIDWSKVPDSIRDPKLLGTR